MALAIGLLKLVGVAVGYVDMAFLKIHAEVYAGTPLPLNGSNVIHSPMSEKFYTKP